MRVLGLKLLITMAATIALMVGCGGSDEEPLTKAEFVKQADRICTRIGQDVQTELSTYVERQPAEGKNQTQQELFAGAVEEILLPAYEANVSEIGSLAPPAEGEEKVNAYLRSAQQGIDEIKKDAGASFAKYNSSLYQLEKPLEPSFKMAGEYGLQACSR